MSVAKPRYPRFEPGAELVVDAHNGHEVWTGAEWNAFVEAAERNRNLVAIRLIECPALPETDDITEEHRCPA